MSPVRVARVIAVVADFTQIVVFPYFLGGLTSPLDAALDTAVAAILWSLLGWHWAFLPTFAAEAVPFLDLVPTWTAAVFLVTRRGGSPRSGRAARAASRAEGVPQARRLPPDSA